MAQETTTLNAESGASYVYDVYMSDTQEGIFGADITPDSVLEMSLFCRMTQNRPFQLVRLLLQIQTDNSSQEHCPVLYLPRKCLPECLT